MLPLSGGSDTVDLGPIRAGSTELSTGRSPLLFWVLAGSGRVTAGSAVHEIPAGELLWIPAGVRYAMETDSSSVAFPILLPPSDGVTDGPTAVTRLRVPPGWEDRLIHEFVHNLGYLRGDAERPTSLFEMIARADDGCTSLPRLPQSREAFEIAHALLRTPGADDTEGQFAKRAGISTRTLQRYFVEETGLTFTRWRLRARITASLEYLKQDREIGWIANEVGFETGSGFTRAFRAQMGESPSDYRRRTRSRPTDRSARTDNDQALVRMLAQPGQSGDTAPPIPANATWPRVNGAHVAVWVYRGEARVDVADRSWELRTGEAMILPAGVRNTVTVPTGSLLLPLGFRASNGSTVTADALETVQFSPEHELALLHTFVAAYTPLRPRGHNGTAVFDIIATGPLAQSVSNESVADSIATRLAATIAARPADPRTLDEWAREFGTDAARLRREFRTETGSTYPQWRSLSRMTQARTQLQLGIAPGTVSRNLGYAHLSAFSRAFRTAHGIPPQRFQAQSVERALWLRSVPRAAEPSTRVLHTH
ncbi:helix-turn-helix domain-containing protein [Rhodococcus sp. NPDC057135]|uniref:helix-turn-helix domain-containing protein n=1 Tax=Rhodococcus sp. NPDC057135 TaxID=3346028 RepID=UPI003644AD3D